MKTKDFIQQDWVKKEIISRVNYNSDTGELTWAERGVAYFDKIYAGKTVGYSWVDKDGYTNYTIKFVLRGRKTTVSYSRVVWLVNTGDWPKHTVDHIDRDTLNNKWGNLRDVPQVENNYNRSFYKCNKLGYKGVRKVNNKYLARFGYKGKNIHIGYHDTPEDAARAYDRKAKELLGDKAILNFPEENS